MSIQRWVTNFRCLNGPVDRFANGARTLCGSNGQTYNSPAIPLTIPQGFCQQSGRRGLPERQEPQNRCAMNSRARRETGRTTAFCETTFGRNFDRITEIVEIVMCFSPASSLDIVSLVLPYADLLETAVVTGVETSGTAACRIVWHVV